MKAALAATNLKTNTVTAQQIRQLSLQQQLIAQHRKLPQQKMAQIGQVYSFERVCIIIIFVWLCLIEVMNIFKTTNEYAFIVQQ